MPVARVPDATTASADRAPTALRLRTSAATSTEKARLDAAATAAASAHKQPAVAVELDAATAGTTSPDVHARVHKALPRLGAGHVAQGRRPVVDHLQRRPRRQGDEVDEELHEALGIVGSLLLDDVRAPGHERGAVGRLRGRGLEVRLHLHGLVHDGLEPLLKHPDEGLHVALEVVHLARRPSREVCLEAGDRDAEARSENQPPRHPLWQAVAAADGGPISASWSRSG
mmetsp:Transcript_7848/g.24828  ORF Transcript_7848/g.24828 Transcript_7848/m.24828 type:complete len:228 (+) Transcript_7848:220-903(+)